MKKSVISTTLLPLLFGLSSLLTTRNACAQMPPGWELKTYTPRDIDLSLQTRYYQATGNYTKSGNSYDSLPSGDSYTNYQFDLAMRTQILSRAALFASTTFGYAQSSALGIGHTNSALSEATVGTDFLMSEGQISLIPEISLTLPFTTNSYSSDTVAVGEGASALAARMIALLKFPNFQMGAFAGFTYRDQGLSSLLPYGVLGELNFGTIKLGADLRGYTSIGYDKSSDNDLTRSLYFCRANGCAARYDAINPALLETNAWLKIAVNRTFDLSAGLGSAITGQATSSGYSANVGLQYHWGLGEVGSTPAPPPTMITPAVRQKRVTTPTFHEEVNDGVDQTLFAPPPPPIQQQDPDAQRIKAQKKMQNDLDKTEMQIELKSNKKKKRPQTQ